MPTSMPDLWSGGAAYERYMGRWSRKIASQFVAWINAEPGTSWIDIGCGTGELTKAVIYSGAPSRVVGIDASAAFLQGDAQSLPEDDDAFDVAVSGLVLNFIPDKKAALKEMVRVVEPGGIVGLYVWDYAGHMQVMRHFFDVATALDPRASEFDDGVKAPICRPGPLADLFSEAGLKDVAVQAIDISTAFENFDDYWSPFLAGTGSAPKYCMSLTEKEREQLSDALRTRLPTGPDGESYLRRGLGRQKDALPVEEVLVAPEGQTASGSYGLVCSRAVRRQSAYGGESAV